MARASKPGDRGDAAKRPQDPRVERLRPDPSQPPEPTRTLEGLLGDSDRPGFRRLYFTPELDYHAEFRSEDVIAVADIPADQPPFLGEPATRVTLRRDAPVDFTRTRTARPLDEFDLDVRLAEASAIAREQQELTVGCPWTQNFVCQPQSYGCPVTFPLTDCHCPPGGGGGGGTEVTVCQGPITVCRGFCDTRRTDCDTCRTDCGTCETCRGRFCAPME